MLGALGGATVVGMILSRNGLRGGVVVLWLLFAAVAMVHHYGAGLL